METPRQGADQMTWQRIDENTYVDDTLVTCAEYQLFIDEMREQGKYYQPDHWNSYQFSEGQAMKPILGMRHSNAHAFCEWLTRRDTGKWKYHLPTQENVNGLPTRSVEVEPMGYWLDEKYQFVWIGTPPNNIRPLALNQSLDRDVSIARAFGRARSLNSAINRVRTSPLDLERDLELGRSLDSELGFILAPLLSALDRPHDPDRDLHFDLDLNIGRIFAQPNSKARDHSLEICIDLLTLRERIAGRSRAFEGIRLVKERK
jgi:hypothetical protein